MASEQRITKINFIAGDWNMFRVKTNNYNSKVIVIFKRCIGRIYDPDTKCWMFPNKCYKFLYDTLNTENDGHYLIENTLAESELNNVQVVIAKEDINHFYVKIPFNETLIDYFREINGFFQTESKLWSFQQTSRQEFEDLMKDKQYTIKYEKDQPKSMFKKIFNDIKIKFYF